MKDYRTLALESLKNKAATERLEALASLQILLEHPAGIGDHSTSDLHDNLNESLMKLADADDKIETLERYFIPPKNHRENPTPF
tara:strand:- start:452 stop:703 length:252 start_codon:yes stop_codon:yes gene_type:complete